MNKDELSVWAQRTGKTEAEIEQEFENLKVSEIISGISDPNLRELEALRVLKARYARVLLATGQEKDFVIMVLRKAPARKVPVTKDGVKEDKSVLNVYGFGRKAEGGEFQYMRLAAWGDADINPIGILIPYTVYKVNIRDKGKGQGTITENTKWTKDKEMKKEVALSTLRKLLGTIPFTDYESIMEDGKTYYVEGSVVRHHISEKDGRKFASYTIIPSDMTSIEDQIQTQGLTVWVDPDMVKHGDDSLLLFVGKFVKSKTGSPVLSGEVVVPIIDYPLQSEEKKSEVTEDPFATPTAPAKLGVKLVAKPQPAEKPVAKPSSPPPQKKVDKKENYFDNVKILDGDEDPFS
jgi:hypothetical protein